MLVSVSVRISGRIIVNGVTRTRGRPKQTCMSAIKKNMKVGTLIMKRTLNQAKWMERIHAVNSKFCSNGFVDVHVDINLRFLSIDL